MDKSPRLDLMKLIGIILEALLYGIFITLLYEFTVILVERAKEKKRLYRQPIFTVSMFLLATITGHFIGSILEVAKAFIPSRDASFCVVAGGLSPAEMYFIRVSNPYNLASSAFYVAALLIGDWFLIYRLYIVWGKNIFVTVPAVILSLGYLAAGIGVTHEFSRDTPVFSANKWITATVALTLADNLYSTSTIAFKLITTGHSVHIAGIRRTVLETLIQSAAITSLLAILLMAFVLSDSTLVYLVTALVVPWVGINFCLILIRTHTRKSDIYLIRSIEGERLEFATQSVSLPSSAGTS